MQAARLPLAATGRSRGYLPLPLGSLRIGQALTDDAQHGLDDNPNWFALTGERAALASVWKNYGIEPGDFVHEANHAEGHATVPAEHHAAASPEMLGHTDAIYFIDPEGRERALLRGDAAPEAIADNLEFLID